MSWKDLSIRDRAAVIRQYVANGIYSLSEIENSFNKDLENFKSNDANFVQRLRDNDTRYIQNEDGSKSTTRLGYATDDMGAIIFPEVQEGLRGLEYGDLNSAIEKQDTVRTSIPFAQYYTENYKIDYPEFFNKFNNDGDTKFKQYGPGGWIKNHFLDKASTKVAEFSDGLLTKDEAKTIIEHPTDYAKYLGWDENTINEKSLNFYRNTSPWGYDILSARDAVGGNKGQDYPLGTTLSEKMARDYLFAEYLGIPQKERKEPLAHKMFETSTYKPSMGGDDENYIRFSTDYNRNKIVDIYNNLLSNVRYTPGSNKMKGGRDYMTSFGGSNYRIEPGKSGNNFVVSRTDAYDFNIDPYAAALGSYTLGTGYDNSRGQYVSIYDRWDLNPFRYQMYPLPKMLYKKFEALGDASGELGKPVNFYDRVYLDDYYGVNSKPKNPDEFYGGYIIPAVVTANKKSNGSSTLENKEKLFEDGGNIFSGKDKNQPTQKLKRVDIKEWFDQEGNRGRAVNIPAMEQLQDSLIARRWGLPQRLAIMATAAQEMDENGAASRGVGGNGYLGYSFSRMPEEYLDDSPEGRGKQINFLFEDLLKIHSDNWLNGGSGGPKIMNGQDGYNQFWNGDNVYETTRVLNKSNIRPAGRLDAWNNRANVAKAMQKHLK